MVKSLMSRLFGATDKQIEHIATPDITRVTGRAVAQPAPTPTERKRRPIAKPEVIDVEVWKTADINHLCETWKELFDAPEDSVALNSFKRAIHNLHGASGAYGGGPLTRLSGSLQILINGSKDPGADAALINLHVQACRAAMVGGENTGVEIADAVCEQLEAQVEAATSKKRRRKA